MATRLDDTDNIARETVEEAQLRRWLTLLRRPDQLASADMAELLRAHGRLPNGGLTGMALGQVAADLLVDAIDRLKPTEGASREQELPHQVLTICFIEGAKLWQAAARLGISERQLSRERARAIKLLKAELEAPLLSAEPVGTYRPEPIPTIRGFLARPAQIIRLREVLEKKHLVNVHGPPGIGKTSLVAELANEVGRQAGVLWYRFRPGVNSSLNALLFELGDYLGTRGFWELRTYMDEALTDVDGAIATRLALKGLADAEQLMIFDDHHFVATDSTITGWLDEMVVRLPRLRVVTVGRHRYAPTLAGTALEIAPFSRDETRALLKLLGVECDEEMVHTLHSWTEGIPHLIKLAASWLKTATPDQVANGVELLGDSEEVQSFLMSQVTELLDTDDKAVLETASIFRERCSDDALAYVAGKTRGAVLDASLRLVRAYVATRSKEGDSAFFHTSLRDYVYERLDPDHKAELHLRAASWYRKQNDRKEAGYHRKLAAEAEAEFD